ncbi:uncharacterized protein LOC132706603 [Cylas formicarius]|uniref:Odorant binding protein n=1 Tax=Cylas formicarius TaxID=197179 RepID=A0A6B7M6R2_CYLFO|nr:uncharacterized protein LOC132706603 [Cylas formicarius]QFO46769.1 odorant binding protein [Cylas formicarius]
MSRLLAIVASFLICGGAVSGQIDLMSKVRSDAVEKCLKDTGVSLKDLLNFQEMSSLGEKEMCFAKCLSETMGLLGADGELNFDEIKAIIPAGIDAEVEKKGEECARAVGKISSCADMGKLFQCYPQ